MEKKDKTEKISDLILKSGGLKSEADLGSAKFSRAGKVVGVDLINIMQNRDDINNLVLNSGDALEIPRKKETVTITGQVYNSTSVPYSVGLKFKDYCTSWPGVDKCQQNFFHDVDQTV
jgi:protein involved in polysaccharide export with SLBB domain